MIAIVGSRNASAAGLKFAGKLAHDLTEAGFVMVSGLARGIDQSAHLEPIWRHGRAVPGSTLDPRAAGATDLIEQGATLVTDASDIIQTVAPIMGRPLALSLREDDDELPASDPRADERERLAGLLGPRRCRSTS
jgi:predicted Rossmann fold nucleotide-binding protein DprA/Smf involved in DNA uptake